MRGWEVRYVYCPRCGAEPREQCIEGGRYREANHAERVERYAAGLTQRQTPREEIERRLDALSRLSQEVDGGYR